jgi:hypothetical protein
VYGFVGETVLPPVQIVFVEFGVVEDSEQYKFKASLLGSSIPEAVIVTTLPPFIGLGDADIEARIGVTLTMKLLVVEKFAFPAMSAHETFQ